MRAIFKKAWFWKVRKVTKRYTILLAHGHVARFYYIYFFSIVTAESCAMCGSNPPTFEREKGACIVRTAGAHNHFFQAYPLTPATYFCASPI